jgi:hypothetical protein
MTARLAAIDWREENNGEEEAWNAFVQYKQSNTGIQMISSSPESLTLAIAMLYDLSLRACLLFALAGQRSTSERRGEAMTLTFLIFGANPVTRGQHKTPSELHMDAMDIDIQSMLLYASYAAMAEL